MNHIFETSVLLILDNGLYRRFSYAGNWELVKSIVGTKFGRIHACLDSKAGNRL